MICTTCIHYSPYGLRNPVAPSCTWRPTFDEAASLEAILPSPHLSRAMVMPSPLQVEECVQWVGR
jgi:hypothetical protein